MTNRIAQSYARALYDISKAANIQDQVLSELRTLKQVFTSDSTISEFIQSPLIPPDQKVAAIKATLSGKVSEQVANTLALMTENGRLHLFNDLVAAYEAVSDEAHGVTRGTVRSATVLSPEARKQIEDTVKQVTQKQVILNFSEDPSLLGGMIAQVGGWTFDDSLETHLTRMSEELNRRAH